MLTPREATEAPTQRSRSPLSPTEVTELATVRLFLILSALLCSLRPGFCIVCDFAHARPIMLQHSTSNNYGLTKYGTKIRPKFYFLWSFEYNTYVILRIGDPAICVFRSRDSG